MCKKRPFDYLKLIINIFNKMKKLPKNTGFSEQRVNLWNRAQVMKVRTLSKNR